MTGQTATTAIERAERRSRAVDLRREGLTLREVANELGVSVYTAWNDIQTAVRDIPKEEADLLRQQEADRLDALQHAIWEKAIAGDLHAIDRVLKIIERRCRLMGLDSPARIDTAGVDLDLDRAVRGIFTAAESAARRAVTPPKPDPRFLDPEDLDFLDYTPDGRPLRDDGGNLIDYSDKGEVRADGYVHHPAAPGPPWSR